MRFITEKKYDYSDVLIVPKRSTLTSRKDVSLNREFTFRNSKNKFSCAPVIVANMDSVGTMTMALELNKFNTCVALHKHYSVEKLVDFFSDENNSRLNFYSMGILEKDVEKFKKVYNGGNIKNVNIDVPNGYIEKFVEFIKKFRGEHPTLNIMAGNVVTGDMTEELILAGADIVKIGIGGGSVCETRIVAGVGYPQLSAVIECADSAHGLGGHICGDGGLVTPGDFGKGFGGGADFLMAGGMFAGHDECEGEFVYPNNTSMNMLAYSSHDEATERRKYNDANSYFNTKDQKFYYWNSTKNTWDISATKNTWDITGLSIKPTHMKFYGMSSAAAMNKHSGGVAEYRASEGKEVLVPYKGPVENTIKEILGGVRSTCTYVGAKSLKELSKRTTFILVNRTHNKVFGG